SGWLGKVARKLLRGASAPRRGRAAPSAALAPEPASLTPEQASHLLGVLRAAGYLPEPPAAGGPPQVPPEQLDHVVHALRLSGALGRLTAQQVENIVYALRVAGHLDHLKDLRAATYDDGHLFSFHNADFLRDPVFTEAYRLGQEARSWQN